MPQSGSFSLSFSFWVSCSLDWAKLRDCEENRTVSVFLLFSVAQTKSYSSRPGCFHQLFARSRSLWSPQVESYIVFIKSTRSRCAEVECILTPTCWVSVCVCVSVCDCVYIMRVVSPLPLVSVEVCGNLWSACMYVCVCVWVFSVRPAILCVKLLGMEVRSGCRF